MSNQLTPAVAKSLATKSMRIALKLLANDVQSSQADVLDIAPIKPCSLAQALGATAIDLEIDVSSLDKSAASNQTAKTTSLSFSDYFALAIEHIEQQHTVLLSHPELPYRLLMMPAIVAAKHRCHPHAYLTGMGEDTDPQVAIDKALTQAKRAHISPTQVDATHITCYKDKYVELIKLISNIAGRSLPSSNVSQEDQSQPSFSQSFKYWFSDMHQSRVTSFSFTENASQHAAVFVQGTELAEASSMLDTDRLLFTISANNLEQTQLYLGELKAQLQSINDADKPASIDLHNESAVISLMLNNLKQFEPTKSLSAVIMASSITSAIAEIEAMLGKIQSAHTEASNTAPAANINIDYKTPSGSCLYASNDTALGNNGLCFVYPGVGTVYPQMFAQLPRYFPALFAQLERDGDVKAMLQAEHIYAKDAQVANMSLDKLAIAGVGASYILTKVLTQHFAIKPNFAMGYSMGEASMWASLDVWKTPHNMIEATQTNSIFTTDISGRLDCVRQAWQLNHGEDIVWNSFVVRANAADIEKALADYPRAYLAIIQGDTCVLAGCEHSCKALLKQIGKRGIAANRVTAMHTQPAMLIRDNVQTFYHQPLHEQDVIDNSAGQIKFISAASQSPIQLTSQHIADSIADTFCQPLNFTELVNNTRKLGARLFVEIGADRQTTTLIDKIARTSDSATTQTSAYQAIAVNAKGDDQTALLKCIAQLITHKVPLSLNYLTDGLSNLLAKSLVPEARQSQQTAQLAPQLEGEQS